MIVLNCAGDSALQDVRHDRTQPRDTFTFETELRMSRNASRQPHRITRTEAQRLGR
jgi:hypothetical protein